MSPDLNHSDEEQIYIGNCSNKLNCPSLFEALEDRYQSEIDKFCSICSKDVRYVNAIEDLIYEIRLNRCVGVKTRLMQELSKHYKME